MCPKLRYYLAVQPWVKGFNGETRLGGAGQDLRIFTRLWIDQELKDKTY